MPRLRMATAEQVRIGALKVSLAGLGVTALLTSTGFWAAVAGSQQLAADLHLLVLASVAVTLAAIAVASTIFLGDMVRSAGTGRETDGTALPRPTARVADTSGR